MKIDQISFMPSLIALGSLCFFLAIRSVTLILLKRRSAKSEACKIVFRVIRFPSYFWCIIAGIRVSTEFWHLSERILRIANVTIAALAIISITLASSKFFEEIAYHYLGHVKSPLTQSGLIRSIIQIVTFTLGLLILLSHIGVKIEALLTALGVGGIAVGLALQDTLSNVFAGIGLLIDRAITIGSKVALENGQNGIVEDIGWRTTRIRLESNDTFNYIINIKISQCVTVRKNMADK